MENLKNLSIIFFILLVSLGSLSYYSHIETLNKTSLYEQELKRTQDSYFLYIKGIISDSYRNSKEFIDNIGSKIKTDILENPSYQDSQVLLDDLADLNQDNHLIINIIANNIQNKYLHNIKNDHNDPFVFTKQDGIIGDLSIDCSAYGRTRSFENEYKMHYSPELAQKAIDRLIKQDIPKVQQGIIDNPIGWSFLTPEEGVQIIDNFTWENLEEVLENYGLKGLKSYEFLYPFYIDPKMDILKRPTINSFGKAQVDSKQIIVVSGFNIVDIIENDKNHLLAVQYYVDTKENIEKSFESTLMLNRLISLSTVAIFLISFVSLSLVLNKELEELKNRLDYEQNKDKEERLKAHVE